VLASVEHSETIVMRLFFFLPAPPSTGGVVCPGGGRLRR
jgi:hypothetical protein